jgi:hypothetical protein
MRGQPSGIRPRERHAGAPDIAGAVLFSRREAGVTVTAVTLVTRFADERRAPTSVLFLFEGLKVVEMAPRDSHRPDTEVEILNQAFSLTLRALHLVDRGN